MDEKTDNIIAVEEAKHEDNPPPVHFTAKEEKKLLRKVDLNLLLIIGTLYALGLIDRVNLSSAAVAGMSEDMKMLGTNRYSIVTLIFFIPFVLVELPANIIIQKTSPRWILGTCAVLWGCTLLGMGFSTDWTQILGCRILLGIFEGGYSPACSFLIQCWYLRKEVQFRYALFYYISVLATGFSAILAYGLTTLEGTYGIRGWRWIFIVEGAATAGLGIFCYIFVQDFPDRKSRFLSEDEIAFIRYRIDKDRGDAKTDSTTFSDIVKHYKDPKVWLFGLMMMCATAAAYSNGFFLPIILNQMGFNVRDSQLLTAPPVVFAVMMGVISAKLSDKLWLRSPFIVFQACLVTIGVFMMSYCEGNAARYAGTFINVWGAQGNVPSLFAFTANNICSYSKRAATTALVVSFSAIGGIYSTTVYREQDKPHYYPACYAILATQLFIIVTSTSMAIYFKTQNRRQERGTLSKPIENTPGNV